jgi:hypothetical protein
MLEVKTQPSVKVSITLKGQPAERLSVAAAAQGISVTEWLQAALEHLLAEGETERAELEDWQALGLKAFEAGWDNPDDAVYDNWREAYGVLAR